MENLIGSSVRRTIGLISALLLLLSYPTSALAQVKLSPITKWEVIGSYKVVGYVGETPYLLVSLNGSCPSLSVGGRFILRSFSPSLKSFDTVTVNGIACEVIGVELIRQN